MKYVKNALKARKENVLLGVQGQFPQNQHIFVATASSPIQTQCITKPVGRGVYSSVYSYIHIYKKTAIFSRFYKKNWGHVIKKIRFFAQKRQNLARNWHL